MPHCKIVLKDEVNCKIEGLDVSMRRRLMNQFKYKLPHAYHIPAVKLGRWDGCLNFFQLGGSTYINMLPEILPELESRNYTIELEDNRKPVDIEFTEIDENYFGYVKWPADKENVGGQPIKLRDYQVSAVNALMTEPQGCYVLSTAGGKTLITAALSKQCESIGRTIVIVPSKKLVEQTYADYKMLGLDVGLYYGKVKDYDKTHTICTWQSLNALIKRSKDGEALIPIDTFVDGLAALIVDEVHAAKAEILKSMLSDTFKNIAIRWGVTGTIPKEEHFKKSIFCAIGMPIAELSASKLQADGHIANCQVNIVETYDNVVYDKYPAETKYLLTNEKRIKYIAKMIAEISKSGNTMVLISQVNPGRNLVEQINQRFIDNISEDDTLKIIKEGSLPAVFVSGITKDGIRDEAYESLSDGNGKIIVATYGVASVGIDIPRIFNLVLIEPGKSFVRVIQSIGRSLRKAADKDFATIWDIASNAKYSKRHLAKRKQFYKEAAYSFTIEKTKYDI